MTLEIKTKEPDGIFCSSRHNMGGLEITQDGLVIPNGKIFFGGDFILDQGDKFTLILQQVKNGSPVEKIPLKANTQRKARMEINKLDPRFKWSKPAFMPYQRYADELAKQESQAGEQHNF